LIFGNELLRKRKRKKKKKEKRKKRKKKKRKNQECNEIDNPIYMVFE